MHPDQAKARKAIAVPLNAAALALVLKQKAGIPQLAAGAPLRTHEVFCLFLAQLFGGLLDKQRRELHRLYAHSVLAHLGRDILELLQRPRRQGQEPSLGPAGVLSAGNDLRYFRTAARSMSLCRAHGSVVTAHHCGPNREITTSVATPRYN